MKITTYYQTDDNNIFLYAQNCASKPHRGVCDAPPKVTEGSVAVWETTLCPAADTLQWGEPGTGQWSIKVDHRKADLYRTQDGAKFELGESYDGIGPLPSWLTTEPKPSDAHTWVNGAWHIDPADQAQQEYDAAKAQVDAQIQSENNRSTAKIAPLQDAVDLGIATEVEQDEYNAWRTYRVMINRMSTQPDYPHDVQWPIAPDA